MQGRIINHEVTFSWFRAASGFIAFNFYVLFLIAAFEKNTAYLFDYKKIEKLVAAGKKVDIVTWGWGEHYIWCLFTVVVSAAISGFLTGAISKSRGGVVAVISNIPANLLWVFVFYLLVSTDNTIFSQTGYTIISLLAIPFMSVAAYSGGKLGEEYQKDHFGPDNVLGIKSYHWIWIIIPGYFYAMAIIYVTGKFVHYQILTWASTSIFAAIVSLLLIVAIYVWCKPGIYVYKILSGELLKSKSSFVKAMANFGIIIFGVLIAGLVQFIAFWLIKAVF